MKRDVCSTSFLVTCSLSVLCELSACRRRMPPIEMEENLQVETIDAGSVDARATAVVDPLDLVPGTLEAFGLRLPLGATERLVTQTSRSYYISAQLSRVNRYLQQQLSISNAEIHPLGMMVRGAYVRRPGQHGSLDVGVREEGDRTLITVWFHSDQQAPSRNTEESLRAAGIDPQTGRALPENNF